MAFAAFPKQQPDAARHGSLRAAGEPSGQNLPHTHIRSQIPNPENVPFPLITLLTTLRIPDYVKPFVYDCV